MNLTFDSVEELGQFLHWAVTELAPRMSFKPNDSAVHVAAPDTPYPKLDTAGVAFDTPPGEVVASGKTDEELTQQADAERGGDKSPEQPATRKRRTKTEIAADAARIAADATAREVADANRAEHFEEAGEAMQAAAGDVQQPDGTNPFDQVAEAAGGPASAADDAAAPDESAGDAVVTPFQHLTRAREFIAKHGMPKYNESFTKAGLDANVMGYSAYQRGLHMDALDALAKA